MDDRSLTSLAIMSFAAGAVASTMVFGVLANNMVSELHRKQATVDYLMEHGSPYRSTRDYLDDHTFEEVCGVEL